MNSILIVHQTLESKLSGLLKTPLGLCIVSSQPIASGGEVIGSMVSCRVVDERFIDELGDSMFLELDIHPLLDVQSMMTYETVINSIKSENPILISKSDAEKVKGYSVINDLYGTGMGSMSFRSI